MTTDILVHCRSQLGIGHYGDQTRRLSI